MIPPELALVGGAVLVCMAFAMRRGATALTWSFVVGHLLLPSAAAINFQGLPPIDKGRAIWLGALLGTLLFQRGALARIRWHRADAVLLAVVLLWGYSSIVNGLGYWDGLSASGGLLLSVVLPYMLARAHFRKVGDLVSLGKVLFWGAVLYVPLAVWEFRMSPQLHNTVYGYFPHSWLQHVRWGFYRPIVFLGHGLGVGVLFSSCLLIGLVLLRRRLLRWPLPFPVSVAIAWVGLGLAVAVSVGPLLAAPLGWAVFRMAKRWPRATVAAGVPGVLWVVAVFTVGSNWSWMTRPFEAIGATRRAASLQYRLDAMVEHVENIRERPWFGHGGWGRGRIEKRATDSEALRYILTRGFLGAGAWYTWMFWTVFAAIRVAKYTGSATERDMILLYAALMGIAISTRIFGTAASVIPPGLIGGAVTGLALACSDARVVAAHRIRGAWGTGYRPVLPRQRFSVGQERVSE